MNFFAPMECAFGRTSQDEPVQGQQMISTARGHANDALIRCIPTDCASGNWLASATPAEDPNQIIEPLKLKRWMICRPR
jgi:hypothetical protein